MKRHSIAYVGFALILLLLGDNNFNPTIVVVSSKSTKQPQRNKFSGYNPIIKKRFSYKKDLIRNRQGVRNRFSNSFTKFPLPIQTDTIQTPLAFSIPSIVVGKAIQWASVLGLQLKEEKSDKQIKGVQDSISKINEIFVDNQNERYSHLPLSLLPSIFPSKSFNEVVDIAPLLNKLIAKISLDEDFLIDIHKDVVKNDDFTKKLLQVYQKYGTSATCSQPITMGLIRSDYLMDSDIGNQNDDLETNERKELLREKSNLLQVELNTIASSFGSLCGQTSLLHTKLIDSLPHSGSDQVSVEEWYNLLEDYTKNYYTHIKNTNKNFSNLDSSDILQRTEAIKKVKSKILKNPSTKNLPRGLYEAHQCYMKTTHSWSTSSSTPIIMFVVQTDERNVFDQRLLEYKLWEDYGVNVIRQSLTEISENCIVDQEGKLRMKLTMEEISVVYFRAGYTPSDYGTKSDCPEWSAREMIEASRAIKCPNIGFHLAGTKKVQQVLCEPGIVEKFLSKEESVLVRRHFTGLFSLGENASNDHKQSGFNVNQDAIENPQNYVLKPQREGGGNNLYDENITDALQTWSQDKLSSYILMERIKAPSHQLHLIRNGDLHSGEGISELGIFGIYIGDPRELSEKTHMNEYAGYLVRSKMADVNEGGVAAGFAVVSSIVLEDEE